MESCSQLLFEILSLNYKNLQRRETGCMRPRVVSNPD